MPVQNNSLGPVKTTGQCYIVWMLKYQYPFNLTSKAKKTQNKTTKKKQYASHVTNRHLYIPHLLLSRRILTVSTRRCVIVPTAAAASASSQRRRWRGEEKSTGMNYSRSSRESPVWTDVVCLWSSAPHNQGTQHFLVMWLKTKLNF